MKNNIPNKRRSVIWKIALQDLQNILDNSKTICEVLSKIGLAYKGNNSVTLKKRIDEDGLDMKQFLINKELFLKTIRKRPMIPLDQILIQFSTYSRNTLKIRLIKEGLIKNLCENCEGGVEWNGLPLTLQLDHKNGDGYDNRLDNLRLLCPNCHSQTPTFAGRKNKRVRISKNAPRFSRRKVERPSKEVLEKLLWEKPTTKIANFYHVSDKAVGKWAKSYGINKPPRGYWTKEKSKDLVV